MFLALYQLQIKSFIGAEETAVASRHSTHVRQLTARWLKAPCYLQQTSWCRWMRWAEVLTS